MSKPNGKDILGLLAKLLADQEGVEITYQIIKGDLNHGTRISNHRDERG
jgi:hypothetical protein